MYIEIAKDIIDEAINNAGRDTNDMLDLLTLFALNAQKGKHLVHVPCLHNNPELLRALTSIMGRSHVGFLRQSEQIFYQLQHIKQVVSQYGIVTFAKEHGDDNAILINPLHEKRFEPYNETHVITENIMDSSFFMYLVKFFLTENAIRFCSVKLLPIMGGGDTTADVLKHEVEDKRFFCLVIADSDRKRPDSSYGQTASKIQKVMSDYSPFHCALYIMDQVMEIENLIPFKVVKKVSSKQGFEDIFDKDASFYDMKCGLTLKCLYDDAVCDYWSSQLYNGEIDLTERNDARHNSTSRKTYQSYIEAHNYNTQLTEGFGSDLILRCTRELDGNGNRIDPHIKEELMNIKKKDLTNFQCNEWEKIGRILFSWTCGMRPHRV